MLKTLSFFVRSHNPGTRPRGISSPFCPVISGSADGCVLGRRAKKNTPNGRQPGKGDDRARGLLPPDVRCPFRDLPVSGRTRLSRPFVSPEEGLRGRLDPFGKKAQSP